MVDPVRSLPPPETPTDWLVRAMLAWRVDADRNPVAQSVAVILGGVFDMITKAVDPNPEARALALEGLEELQATTKRWARSCQKANEGDQLGAIGQPPQDRAEILRAIVALAGQDVEPGLIGSRVALAIFGNRRALGLPSLAEPSVLVQQTYERVRDRLNKRVVVDPELVVQDGLVVAGVNRIHTVPTLNSTTQERARAHDLAARTGFDVRTCTRALPEGPARIRTAYVRETLARELAATTPIEADSASSNSNGVPTGQGGRHSKNRDDDREQDTSPPDKLGW